MGILQGMGSLAASVVAGIALILLGVILFMVSVWTVNVGANWAGVSASADWIVLTAGLIVSAGIIASPLQER